MTDAPGSPTALVATLEPPADRDDPGWRDRARAAWCELAADNGYGVVAVNDRATTDDDRAVGVVEIDGKSLQLEIRDNDTKVVVGTTLG